MKSTRKRTLNILIRLGPAIIWAGVIFYLSHQPATTLEKMMPLFHVIFPEMKSFNWGHFIAYFILALTIYWAMIGKFRSITGKITAVITCGLYGFTDEYHQLFIEGRHFDLIDIRNDVIGATLAMLLISIPIVHKQLIKLSNRCRK